MKRVICLILVMLIVTSLCGCGNQSIGFGNYTFTHVHITDAVEGHCAEVNKWYSSETGIELLTEEFGSVFCSEGTYLLFGDSSNCPFCNE